MIHEQLAVKETPTLLCFLGDVTRDKTHYEHAWELSNQRSARAMRCLGYVYFSEEKVSFHGILRAVNPRDLFCWVFSTYNYCTEEAPQDSQKLDFNKIRIINTFLKC